MFIADLIQIFYRADNSNSNEVRGKRFRSEYISYKDFYEDLDHFKCDTDIRADELSRLLGVKIKGTVKTIIQ